MEMEILYIHSLEGMNRQDFSDLLTYRAQPAFKFSKENASTAVGWIAMTFCTCVQRVNPADFGEPLMLPLAS